MKKIIVLGGALLAGAIALQAQELKTSESISRQFRNNAVPGLKYAPPASPAKATPGKGFTGSSLAKQLREGTLENMVFAGGGVSAGTTAKTTAATTEQASLPSASAVLKPAEKKEAVTTPIPVVNAQGDITTGQADAASREQATIKRTLPVPSTQEEKPKVEKQQ